MKNVIISWFKVTSLNVLFLISVIPPLNLSAVSCITDNWKLLTGYFQSVSAVQSARIAHIQQFAEVQSCCLSLADLWSSEEDRASSAVVGLSGGQRAKTRKEQSKEEGFIRTWVCLWERKLLCINPGWFVTFVLLWNDTFGTGRMLNSVCLSWLSHKTQAYFMWISARCQCILTVSHCSTLQTQTWTQMT